MTAWEALAAALVGAAALFFVLAPLLDAPGTRRRTEPVPEPEDPDSTPRGQALAALREIEFDRATGKLSDEDYAALNAKYTALALEAMRLPGPGGDVEARVAARVQALRRAEAGSEPSCGACGPRPEPDAIYCSTCGVRLGAGARCSSCGGALHPEGRYCETCGAKVAA